MIADYLWLITLVGGAVLLGLLMVFGVARQRRLSRSERAAQRAKVQQLYDREEL